MLIYLIRHTKPKIDAGICYGQLDIGVRESFPVEAECIKCRLPQAKFDAVFTSPLMRCRLLAEKLFGVFTESPLLKEMNFGKWEGLSWNAIYADQQGRDWMNNYLTAACPAGESFQTFCQRITRFTDQLLDTNNSRTAIVTHAGVMRVMQAYLENKPLDRYLSRTIAFGEILPLTTE